jgi:hypothetical protein
LFARAGAHCQRAHNRRLWRSSQTVDRLKPQVAVKRA